MIWPYVLLEAGNKFSYENIIYSVYECVFYVYSGMHYEMLVTMKLFLWGVLLLQVSLTATSESQVSHSFSTQCRKIRDKSHFVYKIYIL